MFVFIVVLLAISYFTGVLTETIDAANAGRMPEYLSFLPFTA